MTFLAILAIFGIKIENCYFSAASVATKVEIDTDEPVIKRLRQEIKEEKPSFPDVQDVSKV